MLFSNMGLQAYDVIPYFVDAFENTKKAQRPNIRVYPELKQFIISNSRSQFWSRCEYEVIISDWPSSSIKKKIDVHDQIMWNIDIITKILSQYLIKLGY